MARRDPEKTCAELEEEERCEQEECFDVFCRNPNINQLMDSFWEGCEEDRMREAARIIYTQKLPEWLRTNGLEKICGCSEYDDNACCGTEIMTGCDDPNQCPNRTWGFDLVAMLKTVVHAASLPYIPVAGLTPPTLADPYWDIPAGTALVWDPTVMADNELCDDKRPSSLGAFVPTDLKALVQECIAEGA